MTRRRTQPPRSPLLPPANADEGAARIRAALVKLFDRLDGNGADWRLMLESLYRAGFELVDGRPDDEARRALMRRVHADAEWRLTGGFADGSGPRQAEPERIDSPLADMAGLKAPIPKPPH